MGGIRNTQKQTRANEGCVEKTLERGTQGGNLQNEEVKFPVSKALNTARIPKEIPGYVMRQDHVHTLTTWLNVGPIGLKIWGPKGSGKSTLVEQFAHNNGIPVLRPPVHGRMEFEDFVGEPQLDEKGSSFVHHVLPIAMHYGCLLLIDEWEVLDPSVVIAFHAILEGAPLVITRNDGEVIEPHPDFRVVFTGNTPGEDRDGSYHGTLRQNAATMDRLFVMHMDYPDEETEMEIIKNYVPLDDAIVKTMVKTANAVRDRYLNGTGDSAMNDTMSTRTLVDWAKVIAWHMKHPPPYSKPAYADHHSPLAKALEPVFLNWLDDRSAAFVAETIYAIHGTQN